VMNPLLVQDVAHHTKNPTTTLLPPMMTMEGMELAGIVLHYLVVVRSSQVRNTYYVTYVYYNFNRSLKVYLIFLGETDFTHATHDLDHGAPASQRVTMMAADRARGRGGGR
jgi:hypothetical protein